jgi:hypothetical protein
MKQKWRRRGVAANGGSNRWLMAINISPAEMAMA